MVQPGDCRSTVSIILRTSAYGRLATAHDNVGGIILLCRHRAAGTALSAIISSAVLHTAVPYARSIRRLADRAVAIRRHQMAHGGRASQSLPAPIGTPARVRIGGRGMHALRRFSPWKLRSALRPPLTSARFGSVARSRLGMKVISCSPRPRSPCHRPRSARWRATCALAAGSARRQSTRSRYRRRATGPGSCRIRSHPTAESSVPRADEPAEQQIIVELLHRCGFRRTVGTPSQQGTQQPLRRDRRPHSRNAQRANRTTATTLPRGSVNEFTDRPQG